MSNFPALWVPGARKEAMDLLEALWTHGDAATRDRLTEALVAGPPAGLYADHENPERSRDRRQFDRIAFLRRGPVDFPPQLEACYQSLIQKYDGWALPEGDRARFTSYSQTFAGFNDSVSDADATEPPVPTTADELLSALNTSTEPEQVIDGWRRYLSSNPKDTLQVVSHLFATHSDASMRLVRIGLIGLRENVKDIAVFQSLLPVLAAMPAPFWDQHDISDSVAELLQDGTNVTGFEASPTYWTVFDRTLDAILLDPANAEMPDDHEWVSLAINRSAGNLASALFSALYSLRPAAGEGFPADQIARLNAMVQPSDPRLRLARVIAASRLSFLFAVDPKWSRDVIIPCLDWANDVEATACWQGFAWHPRLSQELWAAVKDNFFELFTPVRLERLKDFQRTVVEILMLAGIEFTSSEVPTEKARKAIQALSDDSRADAIWWIWTFLSDRSGSDKTDAEERVDKVWRDRVQPWLKRVWPHESRFKNARIATNFGLCAVATARAFPEAVDFIAPFLVTGESSTFQESLRESDHPEHHPAGALALMGHLIDLNNFWAFFDELVEIMARIGAADSSLRTNPTFRRFETFIQGRQ